jgi:Coenzyme PQQ synthesis protein D (PqqD)
MASSPDAVPLTPTTEVLVPEHIVFRSFAQETVMLNLRTGTYHGLNTTAGAMLEALQENPVIAHAAARVAERYGQDPAVVEADLSELCAGLIERDLLVVRASG